VLIAKPRDAECFARKFSRAQTLSPSLAAWLQRRAMLSLIIPLYNEEDNVAPLQDELAAALTRVLAAQYGRHGVRINTICPGTILSESSRIHYDAHPEISADLRSLYPAGAFGKTSDIASAVLFLVSDQASFINGATLAVEMKLGLASLAETITVSGQAPLVEATQSTVASSIRQTEVVALPNGSFQAQTAIGPVRLR